MTWRAFIHLLVSLLGLSGASELPPARNGVSRRAFLRALGVSAAALAALPDSFGLDEALDLDEHVPGGFDLSALNDILKEVYAPAILEDLNRQSTLMQFMEETPLGKGRSVIPVRIGKNYATGTSGFGRRAADRSNVDVGSDIPGGGAT